jgi:heptose I phosphotransferase
MKVISRSDIISRWVGTTDSFEKIKNIEGVVVRSKEGRTTQRFEIDGHGFYAKLHEGIGWFEIIKNCLQLRLPITGATNEWNAINYLHELGVDTMNAVAFGKRGLNPAAQQSYIVTEELTNTLSLAVFAEKWLETPPSFPLKMSIISKVAEIACTIHDNGINHRDLYICHFLLDLQGDSNEICAKDIRLFLVDLHRAQIRAAVPQRWLVKDVGSIYFSSMDIGLTRRDVYRFLKAYYGKPLRTILNEKRDFLIKVQERANRLYFRDFKREPKKLF